MTDRRSMLLAGGATVLAAPAHAQRQDRPPEGGLAASDLMRRVEQRPDFGWLKEFEWDDGGYWEVEYRTRDGRPREIKLDARTGEERR